VAVGLFGNALYRSQAARRIEAISLKSPKPETRPMLLSLAGGRSVGYAILWAVVWLYAPIFAAALGIGLRASLSGSEPKTQSEVSGAKCEIIGDVTTSRTYEGSDPIFVMTTTIRNKADKGKLTVVATFATSAGTPEQTQEVVLDKGESKTLEFRFPEPESYSWSKPTVHCSPA
jgi:hypothetical protein